MRVSRGTTRGARRRASLAALGVLTVFAGGASVYALNTHAGRSDAGRSGVPAPSIVAKPARGGSRTSARFAYTDRRHRVSFQCSLDRSRFTHCASPTRYPGPLAPGWHIFRVRALDSYRGRGLSRIGRGLSRTTSYTWLIDLQPPAPYIARHPGDPMSVRTATFAFTDGEADVAFQCSIDRRAWRNCTSPFSYRRLSLGEHLFRVRALDPPVLPSPITQFVWHVVAQQSVENFSIDAGEIVGGPLYPGAPPQTIRVTLNNPGGVPIFVTSLTVTVPSSPAGCDSATNLSFTQSDVSSAAPVEIQAHDSVTLPAQGRSAPTIQLLNLPVNQDACQNANFPLNLSGSAHT
jgi:hypothetical protein